MTLLPDPREFKPFAAEAPPSPLGKFRLPDTATQHEISPGPLAGAGDLQGAMEAALADGDDAAIARAFAQAPSDRDWRGLHAALCRAIDAPRDGAALQIRLFAIPLLVVAGGVRTTIPGVLPGMDAITQLFAVHGALGSMRNFTLGSALVGDDALAGIAPAELYRRSRALGDFVPLDLPPADIEVAGDREEVHLRFLVGASAMASDAPGFAETAGDIAAWGMPFTRAVAAQIAQPRLSVLAIPRPPMAILPALLAGRFALRELGFQLFLSGALRDFRARTGDPDVFIAAEGGSLRIRLRSPFGDVPERAYAWEVAPADDMATVSASILGLLTECRVERIEVDRVAGAH